MRHNVDFHDTLPMRPRRAVVVVSLLVGVTALGAGSLVLIHPDETYGPLMVEAEESTVAPTSFATRRPTCGVSDILVPECGRWWGVAPGALTGEPYQKSLQEFEAKIDRPVDIYHGYHRNDALFPTQVELGLARDPVSPRLLFLNWKPSMEHTWRQVADGVVDERIDTLADHITTTFPERFFFTIWHEPENDVDPATGSGMTATDYAAMFRHVVQRLRANGVTNAVTVMTYMGAPEWGPAPWFADLYPGDEVVAWIGVDPYINAVPKAHVEGSFHDIVDRKGANWPGFYTWAQQHYPDKPIMVAEWGVFSHAELTWRKAWVFDTVQREIASFPSNEGAHLLRLATGAEGRHSHRQRC